MVAWVGSGLLQGDEYWQQQSWEIPLGVKSNEESACYAGGPGSILGLGKSAGEGMGYPLQYFWASLVAQKIIPQHMSSWDHFLSSWDHFRWAWLNVWPVPVLQGISLA